MNWRNIPEIYNISSLCGWGKPQRTFRPRSESPHSRIARRWIGRRETPTQIFGRMISRTAEENEMEVFWHPLKFIADYAVRGVSRACDFVEPWQYPLFPISPGGPLFFLFSPFALVLAKFRFLADPANLCIISPAIRRANKYHRDNILIDLWYNALCFTRERENYFFCNLSMRFALARFEGINF